MSCCNNCGGQIRRLENNLFACTNCKTTYIMMQNQLVMERDCLNQPGVPNSTPKGQTELVGNKNSKNKSKGKKGLKITLGILIPLLLIAIGVGAFFLLDYQGKKSKYDEAVGLFEEGKFQEAQMLFAELGSFSDADDYVQKSKDEILEGTYSEAVLEYENGNYEQAKVLFQELGNYKEVSNYLNNIQDIYSQRTYEEAMAALHSGDWGNALNLLRSISDYSDARDFASYIETTMEQSEPIYLSAVEYQGNGDYLAAINEFGRILDYKDSYARVTEMTQYFYDYACSMLNQGDRNEAKAYLQLIPEWSALYVDAQTLYWEIMDMETEEIYVEAVNNYEAGQRDTAQRLFVLINGYKDAQDYLSALGTYYYEYAVSLYYQQQYAMCFDLLLWIDTEEEWGQYQQALDLMATTQNTYFQTVYERGCSIYRSKGYEAMASYLDECVCTMFSQDDADNLKNQCMY